MDDYDIGLKVEKVLKSEWKKEVKRGLSQRTELEIREKCCQMRKTRSIKDEPYTMKEYLKETAITEGTDILKTRLHMTKLPCNYGVQSDRCQLCGSDVKTETEHYFSQCRATQRMANIWETKPEDLMGSLEQCRKAKNHLKKVEIMMERYMP